ncbi:MULTISPECIES: glycosyltransferase family 4 protein [Sphingomonas]|uniref:glycosyltransferase family 4 protein n=1 Tax=Sphingomonas TaxID=13687 RepID=UPI0014483D74|nr:MULTISPECIES: glycosyltransferase family 4 protein [Sphingomonas]
MTAPALPLVAILDGSVAITGAVTAACRAAGFFADEARFLLILPKGSSVPAERLRANVQLVTIPLPRLRRSLGGIAAYPWATWRAAVRLKRLLEEREVQTLQVNDFYLLPGPLVRPLGWRGRIVTVVRIDVRRFGAPGRFWLAAARRWSDRLLAVSSFIQRTAALAPDGLIYDPAMTVPSVTPGTRRPILLFVANYIEGKGQDTAIRAFHRIAADFPQAELHFHGGDMGLAKNRAYRAELEEAAAAGPGAARIRFFGFVDDPSPLLAEARAALVLSHSESFSLTCQEASAHGVPVIATRCGGPEEIVEEGSTGYLVEVDDDAGVAERMARLLGDPALAEALGRRGAALMAERFGVDGWRVKMREALGLPQPATDRNSSINRGASLASE